MEAQRIIRVMVVDDLSGARSIVATVLGDDPRIHVVGTTVIEGVALANIDSLRPDVVIVDLEISTMRGLEALAELRRRVPDRPVIVFSATD